MNPKKIVTLSNIIGIVSILLLVYWVFIFVSMEVFGFKVFRENLTQTFYLSIFGIISLMAGALMINIMFNLTRIAQKHNNDPASDTGPRRWLTAAFLLSFPLIFALLFAGDKLTAVKKEKLLLESAKSIVSNQSVKLGALADYSFTRSWMRSVYESLSVMSKTDRNYSSVRIIVRDRINDTPVFLCFGNNAYPVSDGSRRINRVDYIFETSLEQRKYLESVFNDKKGEALFSADDGSYELYFPVIINNRVIVFYFTDRQAYGKIGS